MATNSYPKITRKAWVSLRDRAANAPSTKFTPETVAAFMEMSSPASAQSNTVRPMMRLGLINEDGALTDRGNKWRVDESFGDACQEILDEVYPEDLRGLLDNDGSPNIATIRTWFAHQGFGKTNAHQMAVTYAMIARKEVPEPPGTDAGKATKKRSTSRTRSETSSVGGDTEEPQQVVAQDRAAPSVKANGGPTVHFNIQIHIPADATPERIDQIFSSMARHLYAR